MKTSKKILLTALSATLATTLTSGIMLTALADEATKDHEFDVKNDALFEDFDRDNITNTVKAEGTGVNVGEKPYLRVEYAALAADVSAGDRNSQIYKQGSGTLGNFADVTSISLKMRAPKGDVTLSELNFAVRGVDNENAVFIQDFSTLVDSDNEALPELTAEWQTYEISLAINYENTDVYPDGSGTSVTESALLGFHIFADTGETGTLDIASVSINKTGNIMLNDFIGGETVEATAKNIDSGTWWAGSSTGYIVKRAINMTGGSFTVIKENAVGSFAYAVIEADGDVAHLKVATTTDGTTWGEAVAYDGYSLNLTGEEKGFKFTYDGTAEGGVTVRRIYLTNNTVPVPAFAVPVIDADSAEMLEDFSVAQKGFTGVWEDMSTAPELAVAGLNYRISYNNGDKVEVKDGSLVFDATELAAEQFIDFKFMSKKAVHGKYVVLKVKAEDGATLDSFRFALGTPEDTYGEVIWTNQFKAGTDYASALLGDNNPYKEGDWYYVVANIEESGFGVSPTGYSGMNIYYGGTGKLYIDNVFLCDEIKVDVPDIKKTIELDATHVVDHNVTEYEYGYMYVPRTGDYTVWSFDVTPAAADFHIDNLRFGFANEVGGVVKPLPGTFFAHQNAAGTLLTTDGKTLNQLTFKAGEATHVEIDLDASGILGDFVHVYVHKSDINAFTIDNVKLEKFVPVYAAKDLDTEHAVTVAAEKTFAAEKEGYAYAFGIDVAGNTYGKFEFTLTPGAGFSGADLRFEFAGAGVTYFFDQHEDIVTADGKKFSELTFTEGTPVKFAINLEDIGVVAPFGVVHVHTTGTKTGSFTIKDCVFTPFVDYITPAIAQYYAPKYAEQLAKLPAILVDNTPPVVSVTTATKATAGEEITVAYTVKDNVSATDKITVTVTVTKDGEAVTLTGNKFTAEEGVYTVKVTARDEKGNEGEDVIQITVTKPATTDPGTTNPGTTEKPEPEEKSGCGSTLESTLVTSAIVMAGLAVLVTVSKVAKRKDD